MIRLFLSKPALNTQAKIIGIEYCYPFPYVFHKLLNRPIYFWLKNIYQTYQNTQFLLSS